MTLTGLISIMSKKAKTAVTNPETVEAPLAQHLLIYTDGGAKPTNPGFAGWGLHGYTYTLATPKKGSGNAQHILTAEGYEGSAAPGAKEKAVTPVNYLDGFGSFAEFRTNNVAELEAMYQALLYASEQSVESVTIIADSKYAIDGTTGHLDRWIKNGWVLSNGAPVKNIPEWKRIHAARELLTNRGVKIIINWIKGHSDRLGNDLADKYATIGEVYSMEKQVRSEIVVSAPEGYWKTEVERHPFLNLPYLTFTTERHANTPGVYYQGTVDKDIDFWGRRARDGAFSVLQLAQPEPAVETMIEYHSAMQEESNTIVILRVDELYRGSVHPDIIQYGQYATQKVHPHKFDLMTLAGEPLSHCLTTPLLAYRAADNLNALADVLAEYRAGDAKYVATDITDILYESQTKTVATKSVITRTLRTEFKVGFAQLPVTAQYRRLNDTALSSIGLTLILGIDLLDRNALKRLEGAQPTVTLLTWMESEISFRFCTVIQAGEDWGIWAGIYTNQRVVPSQ